MSKKLYAKLAMKNIPRLLGMVDRNMFSPTYGCFDRNFWHYKIIDFPSGMYQTGVLPLAMVYTNKFSENIFYKKDIIKELCLAGIKFAEWSSHNDGSCDEFYPNERALGATSISLYALSEAYLLLKEKNPETEGFFERRAMWIMNNDEPGTMANHQAAAALALLNVYLITKKKVYLKHAKIRTEKTLDLQSEEGWFREYEGCDPGYLTVTIDFLAKYYKKTGDKRVFTSLKKAIDFASYFMHPDGSYGGVYGSRNTYHFLPDGFEIIGEYYSPSTKIAESWLHGVRKHKHEFIEDDRYFIYDTANRLQAYVDYSPQRYGTIKRRDFSKYFDDAKIAVLKKQNYYVIISLSKGGVVKMFKGQNNIYNDCGLVGVLDNGKLVSTQVIDDYDIDIKEDIRVRGAFNSIKVELPSPLKSIVFRLGLTTLGKSKRVGNLIKKKLTKKLILRKKRERILFERTFEFDNGLTIKDRIKIFGKEKFKKLAIAGDLALIHVPGSRYYQESVLNSWIDLSGYVDELNKNRRIEIKRVIK